ncbi:bifunctional glycosyltransferase family 2/GtrA family protein [Anaerosporobacter sp.]|uniref:bifunctional glycosyltransferase family 2/GtrA family protein n=1 Tax=Anaerosporobacter sp. TaxID=1872529 RepID=UPI00286EC26D|nr:bifunctional glycosyltransferase family 2/GtrA family protein [Anaerosporobacter sp.]
MTKEEVKKHIGIIVPSLSPDEKLLKVVSDLKAEGFENIIVVNDGSTPEYDTYFNQVRDMGCHVCVHEVNKGKGRALKTAFAYVKSNIPDCTGVITVDGDGQHTIGDIIRCAEALIEHPDHLILGCRDFSSSNVPFRSRFGNQLTCKVFMVFTGLSISDTQTGLRGIPSSMLDMSLEVEGERFEYETNMLLKTKEHKIPIHEVSIATVYIEENKTSHFHPLKDSVKIYRLFFKFIVASLSSFVLDIALFALFAKLLSNAEVSSVYRIAIATIGARILSSMYNYYINRSKVFEQEEKSNKSIGRYYILAVLQMAVSALLVTVVYSIIPVNESVIKAVIDCILFLVSFQIQREWVFKK